MVVKLNFLGNELKQHTVKCVLAIGAISALAACAGAPNANLSEASYPNLRAVPTMPEGVTTKAEWGGALGQLQQTNQGLLTQSASRPLTPAEADVNWAHQARDALVSDPKSAPAPATEDAVAWAAQTREKLEAELKTTPH